MQRIVQRTLFFYKTLDWTLSVCPVFLILDCVYCVGYCFLCLYVGDTTVFLYCHKQHQQVLPLVLIQVYRCLCRFWCWSEPPQIAYYHAHCQETALSSEANPLSLLKAGLWCLFVSYDRCILHSPLLFWIYQSAIHWDGINRQVAFAVSSITDCT